MTAPPGPLRFGKVGAPVCQVRDVSLGGSLDPLREWDVSLGGSLGLNRVDDVSLGGSLVRTGSMTCHLVVRLCRWRRALLLARRLDRTFFLRLMMTWALLTLCWATS